MAGRGQEWGSLGSFYMKASVGLGNGACLGLLDALMRTGPGGVAESVNISVLWPAAGPGHWSMGARAAKEEREEALESSGHSATSSTSVRK